MTPEIITALAVTLGVAFMTGTLVLTDTFGQTFNDLSAGVYKGTDAVVRATATFNGPQFTGAQRPFVNASLAGTLSRVPGAAAVTQVLGQGEVAVDGSVLSGVPHPRTAVMDRVQPARRDGRRWQRGAEESGL